MKDYYCRYAFYMDYYVCTPACNNATYTGPGANLTFTYYNLPCQKKCDEINIPTENNASETLFL